MHWLIIVMMFLDSKCARTCVCMCACERETKRKREIERENETKNVGRNLDILIDGWMDG